MPSIEPFKGLRYDAAQAPFLSRLVTPPYDVISPAQQLQFYRRHPWNFIRVVYGRRYASDTASRNCHTRAQRTLAAWIQRGILKSDRVSSLYPYHQRFSIQGKTADRWGAIGLVRLDAADILRHEETHPAPIEDRLALLKNVQASLSPIFGLVSDSHGAYRRCLVRLCRGRAPLSSFEVDGVWHQLWQVQDPKGIRQIQTLLKRKPLVIADGHHRFEAALAYRNERCQADPGAGSEAAYQYTMFYVAAAGGSDKLGLLPTHRLVGNLSPRQVERFWRGIRSLNGSASFVDQTRGLEEGLKRLMARGLIGIGVCSKGTRLLLQAPLGSRRPVMDVEWLHREILPRWVPREAALSYTQDLSLAFEQVRKGRAQLLFVLQPPRLKLIFERAQRGERMPGKTTYFYPKPLAGLVEYSWD